MSLCAILGSSFQQPILANEKLEPVNLPEKFKEICLFRHPQYNDAYLLFRHGMHSHQLPHQIPYKKQILLLKELNCRGLLVTGAVGVLDSTIPLYTPLVVTDLLMPDNRLPDGRICTIFDKEDSNSGHLILQEGLFSSEINELMRTDIVKFNYPLVDDVVFAYTPGPRTKTKAENFYWHKLGAHVNSMTVAPEVIMANECEIATASIVVGHKYSNSQQQCQLNAQQISDSLQAAKQVIEKAVLNFFISRIEPQFKNLIYRF